jgi:hypothetical protein
VLGVIKLSLGLSGDLIGPLGILAGAATAGHTFFLPGLSVNPSCVLAG